MPNSKTKEKAMAIIEIEMREWLKDKQRSHLVKIQKIVDEMDHSIVLQVKKNGEEIPYHLKFYPQAEEPTIAEKK